MTTPSLTTTPIELIGIAASPGIAVGPISRIEALTIEVGNVDDPQAELERAMAAATVSLENMSQSARERGSEEAGDVLYAQSLMASDPMIADAVDEQLDSGLSFDEALNVASSSLSAMLASLPDPYLAARAADVAEVITAIKREIAGIDVEASQISEPSVLLAEDLTAAQTSELDPALVLGFATQTGGATSHVAIIARAMGVPAVVGVADGFGKDATIAALDGSTGDLVLDPDDDVMALFGARRNAFNALRERAAAARGQSVSLGGQPIKVAANVGSSDDIDRASDELADGVGLFRTEFLFLERSNPPSEDEQFTIYKHAAESFEHTVVIRTFDIGGDKPAEYLQFEAEENPFLGTRGIRVYWDEADLFAAQIRAVYRASAFGKLAVMLPMVATSAEIVAAREKIAHVREALESDGVTIGDVAIGAMIEVPSIALVADQVAEHVDFLSIGTNDLTQYTFAADRTLSTLSHLQDPLHPAVLRLCRMVADAGITSGIETSVCGLAAADPIAAVIFAAMGIGKLSVSSASVNVIKGTLQSQPDGVSADVLAIVDDATSAKEIRERVGAIVASL